VKTIPVLVLGLLLPVLILPDRSRAGAGEHAVSGLMKRIESAHQSIQDLQADFSQTTHFKGFDSTVESVGRVYFKKPGRLRWEYTKPNKNQVVINTEHIWIYTPELQQVIVRPFSAMSYSQVPLRLLADVENLDRDFSIELPAPGGDNTKDRPYRLILRPKQTGGEIDRIELEVDSSRLLITRIHLYETNGSFSDISFKSIRTNVRLKDKLFIFKAPKGIEVIEMP
jgi:outer membrane lipoprotein carrier protein